MSTAILILRLTVGGALLIQGATKLTRDGRRGTAEYFDTIGFRPSRPLALVAGATEAASGAMLIAGFGTWLAAAGAIGVLFGATVVSWQDAGYANAGGGAEYPLVLGLAAAALAFSGAGPVSLDEALGWHTPSGATAAFAIALGVATALPLLGRRRMALRSTESLAPVDVAPGQPLDRAA